MKNSILQKEKKTRLTAKYRLLVIFCLFVSYSQVFGQISAWDFQGNSGNEVSVDATTVNANLNTPTVSRGSGLNASALNHAYSSTNFTANGDRTNAFSNNKFIQFSISSTAGYQISLNTLDARFRRSSAGPNTFQWQYSLDGFSTAGVDIGSEISYTGTATNGDDQTQIDLSSIGALQNVQSGTTITFRLYGWGAIATGGTFALGRNPSGNDLSVGGTVSPVIVSTINAGTVNTPPFNLANCTATASGSVTFTSVGTFNSGNVYTAQLSDASGNFANPTDIGFVNSTANSASINITIPAATPTGTQYRIRVVSSNPVVTGDVSGAFTINQSGICISSNTDYFRSRNSGDWNQLSTWESSTNNIDWINATLIPNQDANIITIKNGHTVNITANLTLDQTVVEENAVLSWNSGSLMINDGVGDDLIIFGTFKHNLSAAAPYVTSTIRVKSNGVLEVNNNITSAWHYGSSSQIFYEDRSVFYWNVSASALFATAGITYFPNATVSEKPIFRTNTPNINVGAGSVTRINGYFEVENNTVTWQNAGVKYFRNGLGGNGNITQSDGQFLMDGDTAFIAGTGVITLNINRLQTSGAVYVKLLNNKVINGGQLRITNPSTFDAQDFSLSGTGNIQLNSDATLITKHSNGVDGSVGGLSGGIVYDTENRQNIIFERNGAQNSGTTSLNSVLGSVLIRNGSKLTLQKNLSIENKNNGSFIIEDTDSELRASSTVEININGNRFFTLQNGGSMNDNCLENLTFKTGGNSSTGTFSGNGNTIKCWNFEPTKTTSGGVILAINTPLKCKNNFEGSFAGTAIFTDNGNTITVGDDLRLSGAASNYNFTGTIVLNGEGSGLVSTIQNGSNAISAELNHLIIDPPLGRPMVQFNPQSGVQSIIIKGNLTINSGEVNIYENNLNIGGNWTNNATFNSGLSNVIFNGTVDQFIASGGTGAGKVFHNVTINKTANNVILVDNMQVNNVLTLTSNTELDLNHNDLIINNESSNALVRTAGYIKSESTAMDSRLIRNMNVTGTYLYPFGLSANANDYIPFEFEKTNSGSAQFAASTYRPDLTSCLPYPPNVENLNSLIGLIPDNRDATIKRFWQIDALSGNPVGNITFTFTDTEVNPSNINVAESRMQRYNTDTGNWEAPISGQTTGSRSITVPNVFEFSPWAAADQEISPLPVKWGNFEVSKANDKVDISWATTSEVNNSHFEVEHSLDGSNFVEIGRVVGNGFSNKLLKYHYIHQKPLKGINYYRLKQVDFNGIFDYSDIRYVKFEPNNEMLIKQFADFIQLEFENTNSEDTQIRMIDFSGKLIDIQKVEKGEGIASVNINTQHLAAGAYNIQLIRNGIYVNNVTVAVRK